MRTFGREFLIASRLTAIRYLPGFWADFICTVTAFTRTLDGNACHEDLDGCR